MLKFRGIRGVGAEFLRKCSSGSLEKNLAFPIQSLWDYFFEEPKNGGLFAFLGKIIVEHEQENKDRADYGKKTLKQLSKDLTKEFGKGFSVSNLYNMRLFYMHHKKFQTVSGKLSWSHYCELLTISDQDKRSFYEKETMNCENLMPSSFQTEGRIR